MTAQHTTYSDIGPEVLRAAFSGDGAAFRRVVERYQGPVFNLCLRFVGNPDAEDLAQETFVKAFVHREKFDFERPVLPWLLTIARRLCLDRRRRTAKRPFVDALDADRVPDGASPADDTVGRREELSMVAVALASLPEGQREAVVLHHVDGLPYREIADVLAVPLGTVMTWLHRGRARLQQRFDEMTAPRDVKSGGGEP